MSIILLILLLCSSAMHAGGCVSPIPGENLWRLTARIGSCLDELICAVGAVVPLTQSNLSGGMTITTPGHYKLCEDVTAPSFATILINSDDVNFDLGGFALTNMGIFIGGPVRNVMVQDGVMANAEQFIDVSSGSQNILLQNLTLDTATNFGVRATGTTINNCFVNNVDGDGYILTECVVTNSSAANNSGFGFLLDASNTLTKTLSESNSGDAYYLAGGFNIINDAIANTNGGVAFNSSSPNGQDVLTDCQALNNTSGGFILGTGGFDICQRCTAYDNLNHGFIVESSFNTFESCTSVINGGDGFRVTGNGNSFMFCVSNHNEIEGFYISILDGCMITSSVANENFDCGFLIENIMAEADFDPITENPEDFTWNIGAFAKSLSTTTDRNVRLANNTALQNGNQNIIMKGFVSDVLSASPSQTFTDTIYTTIGIINTLYGSVIIDQKPLPNTIVSPATAVSEQIANVVGGNITDDPIHDPN